MEGDEVGATAETYGLTRRKAAEWLREGRLPPGGAPSELYTADRVAELLGVTPYTVRRWTREGRLGSVKLGRNTVRIPRADLDAFLAANRTGGPSAPRGAGSGAT